MVSVCSIFNILLFYWQVCVLCDSLLREFGKPSQKNPAIVTKLSQAWAPALLAGIVPICNDRLIFKTSIKGIKDWRHCFGTESTTPHHFFRLSSFLGAKAPLGPLQSWSQTKKFKIEECCWICKNTVYNVRNNNKLYAKGKGVFKFLWWVFKGWFKGVSWVFKGCFMGIFSMFQGCCIW